MVLVSITTLVNTRLTPSTARRFPAVVRVSPVYPRSKAIMGCARTMRPTAQGMVMRPIMRMADSSVLRAPRALRRVSWAVIAGKMLMEMGDTKAYGRLKMVCAKLYTPLSVSACPWVNPAAPMSRDMTTLASTRVMICSPAEPMVMGIAMARSRLAV